MKRSLAAVTFALIFSALPATTFAADLAVQSPSPYGASLFAPLEQPSDLVLKFNLFRGKFQIKTGHFAIGSAAATAGTTLANSLLFSAASSQNLSRTPGSPTNNGKWTWSAWVKRSQIGAWQGLFYGGNTGVGNVATELYFYTDDTLYYQTYNGSTNTGYLGTSQVFRDPSAWYHIVLVIDETNPTPNYRERLYVNGVEVTSFATRTNHGTSDPLYFNNASYTQYLGQSYQVNTASPPSRNLDGYMSDVYFVDGQALTPGSFAQTDPITGQWEPIAYKGTYGANGFHLPFTNGAALGTDSSGNSNTWTLNGGITAAANQVTDSPTNNYPTLNPLQLTSGYTLSSANLTASWSGIGSDGLAFSTQALDAGTANYWAEFTLSSISLSASGIAAVGIAQVDTVPGANITSAGTAVLYADDGSKVVNGVSTAGYGSTWTTNDVIGVLVNNGSVTFYKQTGGTGSFVSQGSAATGVSGTYKFVIRERSGVSRTMTVNANFGQHTFNNSSLPGGATALSTKNLPTPTIKKPNQYFDILTYAGDTQPTRTITGLSFQPNFVWIKDRGNANWHGLFDSVRGPNYTLYSNLTNAEDAAGQYGYVSAFNTNGFTIVRSGSSGIGVVNGGGPYVAWNWKAGGTAVTNNAGSVTSQVSANPADGVSVVTWTGPASAIGYTVGHGLGTSPAMIILKDRSGASNWWVWHKSLSNPQQSFLQMDNTTAAGANTSAWNNTAPTASVFSLLSGYIGPSTGQSYVAYVFAEIPGFSKFGSYTGNGSTDGPFIYTGFRPRYVIWKDATNTYGWEIRDTARDSYNQATAWLAPNLSNAEAADAPVDILSNGFKIRAVGTTYTATNQSGDTFIYAAFAESPFKYANAR